MQKLLQIFMKNAMLLGRKSALLLFLATLMFFSGSCSKKMPCPKPPKSEKQAKAKKKKAPKQEVEEGMDDGTEMADASAALSDEGEITSSLPKITGSKNTYNKKGLLQKKKYKRYRSNPGRKRYRRNKGIFSIFSSGKKKSAKKPKSSSTDVEY